MVNLINNVLYLILYSVLVYSLIELPEVDDNSIGITETIIRATVNNLFATLKIRDVGHKSKLKQFFAIHNYFVAITLKDCDNLRAIARLTQVNNIDNNTQHFITQINEVLNEDNTADEVTDDMCLNKHVDVFIKRLRYINLAHGFNSNSDILNYHQNNTANLLSMTNGTEKTKYPKDNALSSSEFWKKNSRRIFQGRKVRIEHFPFMASVQVFDRFHCSGSIIKSDLVITSASCLQLAWNNRFYRENPAFLSVRVGSDYSSKGGEVIPVQEIDFHPLYNPNTLKHDLAVMRLARRIFFKNSDKVRKIDIDRHRRPLSETRTGRITVIGWGARDGLNVIRHPKRNKLAYAELNYYPLDDCRDVYTKHYVTRRHFCAGFITDGRGACNYDAGGPGVIGNILMGVITFGSVTCGASDSPTVFTKLGFYADWIDEIMDQQVPVIHKGKEEIQRSTKRQRSTTKTKTTFTLQGINRNEATTLIPIKDVDFNRLLRDGDYLKDYMKKIYKINNTENNEKPARLKKINTSQNTPKASVIISNTEPTNKIIKFTSALEEAPNINKLTKRDTLRDVTKSKKKHRNNKDVDVIRPSWKHSPSKDNHNNIISKKHKKKISHKTRVTVSDDQRKAQTIPLNTQTPVETIKIDSENKNINVSTNLIEDMSDMFYRRILRLFFDEQ